ncbi:zinc ribbon domain-containing protein [Pediococcus pentosaceus]|nr:zinc ribbon domain-containing protein [Pediococcus pentosaceus]AXR42784.1 hypothetical protein CKK51_01005 [Pediococcus pentosaceus]MBF7111450.1 zinc ribbon domain-containing protein [Pediococcus pentosaceus]MBF7116683.1 zinc ribbon domain-containing protein [Pediococcus pentosaceus]MBF7118423.1 zinc ribbon domain-containing protein [Pediococcus pentosaceus]MCS8575127.1 zinc ribbon domain-containing protein [Pediococcus pentosaceus]
MTYQSSYRVCPKCGYRSNEDSKFCLHCGENIESVEVTKSMDYGVYRKNTSKYLTSGNERENDQITGRVFACTDLSETSSYKDAWISAYKNLISVLDMEELDGAVHLDTNTDITGNQFIVSMNGDGIVTEVQE